MCLGNCGVEKNAIDNSGSWIDVTENSSFHLKVAFLVTAFCNTCFQRAKPLKNNCIFRQKVDVCGQAHNSYKGLQLPNILHTLHAYDNAEVFGSLTTSRNELLHWFLKQCITGHNNAPSPEKQQCNAM